MLYKPIITTWLLILPKNRQRYLHLPSSSFFFPFLSSPPSTLLWPWLLKVSRLLLVSARTHHYPSIRLATARAHRETSAAFRLSFFMATMLWAHNALQRSLFTEHLSKHSSGRISRLKFVAPVYSTRDGNGTSVPYQHRTEIRYWMRCHILSLV